MKVTKTAVVATVAMAIAANVVATITVAMTTIKKVVKAVQNGTSQSEQTKNRALTRMG
jgi:hypothetical protein